MADQHPAKRRRTSPRTSVAISASGEEGGAGATATTTTAAAATANDSTITDAPNSQSPRKKRPDFASPTKASLSRHNPEILARRRRSRQQQREEQEQEERRQQAKAASKRRESSTKQAAAADQPASTPGSPGSEVSLSDLLTAQLETVSPADASGKPRRSPLKPIPFTRPFPPPPPEGEEELIDPFKRRPRIRRSNVPEEPVEEPELPPTPSQLGMEDPTVTSLPQGIHTSSSPSKRRRLFKDRKSNPIPMKKSPLKKQYAAPEEVAQSPPSPTRPHPSTTTTTTTAFEEKIPRAPTHDPLANPQGRTKEDELEEVTAHPARNVEPDEEIRRKLAYLEELKAEEETLRSDLKTISERGREWALQAEATKLVAFIKKHPKILELPEPTRATTAQADITSMLQMALNPSSLLPFSKPIIPSPLAEPPASQKSLIQSIDGAPPPALPSHLPVPMTAEQELPYLQILTPFTFTSHTTPLTDADAEAYVQRHDISIRAADGPHLFSSRLTITVDLADFSVSDLKVTRLEPAARRELGPFIDDLLARTDRALAKNVSLIAWAMGEWYRLALKRAQFWGVLRREMGDARRAHAHAARLWKQRTVQYNRPTGSTVDDDLAAEDDDLAVGDVARDLGRAAMTLGLNVWGEDELMMRVGWRISFDWAGDARSKIDVAIGVPGRWHRVDRNGALAKVPRIFDEYIKGTNDVVAAARRVIALVGYDADAPKLRKAIEA